VKTTLSAASATRAPTATVMPSRSGSTFQIGRPSGTSWMALAARMNPPTYADAVHTAPSRPAIARTPAAPEPLFSSSIAPVTGAAIDGGNSCCVLVSTASCVVSVRSMPDSDSSTRMPGKIDRIP
jgi:hypothetical protein